VHPSPATFRCRGFFVPVYQVIPMKEILFVSTAHTLVLALAAVFLVWATLRLLDWVTGTPFSEIKEVIYADPKAAALYAGLRFLGACLLIGLAI